MEHAAYDRHGQLITDPFGKKVKRVFTSALLLITAFIITNIVFQLITWAVAKIIGYSVGVNYNMVSFSHDYRVWNLLRVIAVDMPAPFFCLLASGILYRALSRNPQWITTQRLFVFWLMVCFGNLFFAQLSASPLELFEYTNYYYNHFACVAAWMGLSAGAMLFIAGFSVIATILFGAFIGREVLRFSFSKGLITTQWGKSSVVFQFYILPVAIGAVPLLLLGRGPSIAIIGLTVFSLIIMALGMLFRGAVDTKIVRCNKQDVLNHPPIIEFVIAAVTWFAIFGFLRG